MDAGCTHPPSRYYAGAYTDFVPDKHGNLQPQERLWVMCCDCGECVADFPLRKPGRSAKKKKAA